MLIRKVLGAVVSVASFLFLAHIAVTSTDFYHSNVATLVETSCSDSFQTQISEGYSECQTPVLGVWVRPFGVKIAFALIVGWLLYGGMVIQAVFARRRAMGKKGDGQDITA